MQIPRRDASRTNAEIGERIGLSASQVSRRRARLEENGVIRRYRAEIDGAQLGFTLNRRRVADRLRRRYGSVTGGG